MKFADLFAKFSGNVPTKTNDISFFSTLEMNNVKKSLSGKMKTIFVRILVKKND